MCSHFRADLTALKRLFHALFVIEQPLLDWFVSIFTMSISFPFSISVCRQERQPSTNQHEKVSQSLRFLAKHDVWLGTGANILSIGKDACLQLFSRPWTFRLKKPGRGCSTNAYTERLRPEVQTLSIWYKDRKGFSFVCDLLLPRWCRFHIPSL